MSADGKTLIGYDVDLLNDLQELLGFEIDGGLQAMDYSALTTSLAENKLDIGAAALCAIYAAVTHGPVVEYAVICAVGALISMVGDLAASAIKRNRGIKDYGKLIPGHGGILDRFDSVIFTSPIIFYLAKMLLGL